MSSKSGSRRCSAIKRDGERCKAWATRGTDRCVAHPLEGRPTWTQHGFYTASEKPLETLDDVIGDVLRRQQELSLFIEEKFGEDALTIEGVAKLFALHSQNAGRIGKLLRDQKALSGDSADDLLAALGVALDEISTGLGIEV